MPRATSEDERRLMRNPGESGIDMGLSMSSVLFVRRYECNSDSTCTA